MGIVSVLQHEKVLEIEFMRINTLNTTELYTLTSGQEGNFYIICILPITKILN